MSTVDDMINKQKSYELVKLQIAGGSSPVNTIRALHSGRGMSLVCPFPALEVDVPVKFAPKGDGEPQQGTIHRIGVEDDPETGLPRLRLSIRTDDGEVMAQTSTLAGLGLDEPVAAVSEAMAESEPFCKALAAPESRYQDTILSYDCSEADPDWANCEELPSPEDILARSRTRRRHRLTSAVAWCTTALVLGSGIYMLQRSGVVSADNVRNYISGFSYDGAAVATAKAPMAPAVEVAEKTAVAAQERQALPAPAALPSVEEKIVEEAALQNAAPAPAPATPSLEEVREAIERAETEEQAAEVEEEQLAAADELPLPSPALAEASFTTDESAGDGVDPDRVNFVLPTRWAPEYSTSYRVRDPGGVVVDVPGALVRREGWLEIAQNHPMVRSIKSVQRETGARFIVYINGDLPRFMTSPRAGGVSLKLFRESATTDAGTQTRKRPKLPTPRHHFDTSAIRVGRPKLLSVLDTSGRWRLS